MSMLKLNDDHDLAIEKNKFVIIDREAALRQRLIQNLKTFFREWFLDLTIGVPYFQIVFAKGAPPSLISSIFKDVILTTEGVGVLERFEPLDYDTTTRDLNVDFTVISEEGVEIRIQEALP